MLEEILSPGSNLLMKNFCCLLFFVQGFSIRTLRFCKRCSNACRRRRRRYVRTDFLQNQFRQNCNNNNNNNNNNLGQRRMAGYVNEMLDRKDRFCRDMVCRILSFWFVLDDSTRFDQFVDFGFGFLYPNPSFWWCVRFTTWKSSPQTWQILVLTPNIHKLIESRRIVQNGRTNWIPRIISCANLSLPQQFRVCVYPPIRQCPFRSIQKRATYLTWLVLSFFIHDVRVTFNIMSIILIYVYIQEMCSSLRAWHASFRSNRSIQECIAPDKQTITNQILQMDHGVHGRFKNGCITKYRYKCGELRTMLFS